MAATVLNSPRAVQVSIFVVRAHGARRETERRVVRPLSHRPRRANPLRDAVK
jgi:hypothetical protein